MKSMMLPPIPCTRPMDLGMLHPEDAAFFSDNRKRSEAFIALSNEQESHIEWWPCDILALHCMDEREQDLLNRMGMPIRRTKILKLPGSNLGFPNLTTQYVIEKEITKAFERGRILLMLQVMHTSRKHPRTHGCAAWNHNHDDARSYARARASRMNVGLHLDPFRNPDAPMKRFLIVINLTSYTDDESRVWHGPHGDIDPVDYVPQSHREASPLAFLEGETLKTHLVSEFQRIFPYGNTELTSGLTRDEWTAVLRQLVDMCFHNIVEVRRAAQSGVANAEEGHLGERILLGQGFAMYTEPDEQLVVSDLSPDYLKGFRIALQFVYANRLRKLVRGETHEMRIPVYAQALFERDAPGQAGSRVLHVHDLIYRARIYLEEIAHDHGRKAAFHDAVRSAYQHRGGTWDDIPEKERLRLYERPFSAVSFLASIAPTDTRLMIPWGILNCE